MCKLVSYFAERGIEIAVASLILAIFRFDLGRFDELNFTERVFGASLVVMAFQFYSGYFATSLVALLRAQRSESLPTRLASQLLLFGISLLLVSLATLQTGVFFQFLLRYGLIGVPVVLIATSISWKIQRWCCAKRPMA